MHSAIPMPYECRLTIAGTLHTQMKAPVTPFVTSLPRSSSAAILYKCRYTNAVGATGGTLQTQTKSPVTLCSTSQPRSSYTFSTIFLYTSPNTSPKHAPLPPLPPPSHPPLHPPPPLTPLIPLSPNPYPSLPPSTLLISPPMEKSTALPRYPIPILHKIFHKIFYQTPFHLSTSPSTFQELR